MTKMFTLLSPLSKYLKLKNVCIYDGIFILHSKVTVCILLACTIVISAKQYFGDPIDCITDIKKDQNFINNFCWTFGTYILEDHIIDDNKKSNVGITNTNSHIKRNYNNYDLPPLYLNNIGTMWNDPNGIGKAIIEIGVGPETESSRRIYLRYYQWVVIILLLQALSFFLPSFLWKYWEGGRLQQLCNELGSVIIPDEWKERRREILVNYFSTDYKDTHMCYALKYAFCEILNCAICIINVLLMNVFFSGFWIHYASALNTLSSYEWSKWNSISSKVFPKMAKCEFLNFGASGSIQKSDVLCLLPLNILNEKLFAFLWLWFIFLISISIINTIYRIFLLINVKFRYKLIRSQLRSLNSYTVQKVLDKMNFGDWFLLYKISTNVNPIIFADLIHELSLYNERNRINTAGDNDENYDGMCQSKISININNNP